MVGFMRRDVGRHEPDLIQAVFLPGLSAQYQMCVVDRIKGTAHNSNLGQAAHSLRKMYSGALVLRSPFSVILRQNDLALCLVFGRLVKNDLFADHLNHLRTGAFSQNLCDGTSIVEAVL